MGGLGPVAVHGPKHQPGGGLSAGGADELTTYAFGDDDPAVARLAMVADAYRAVSTAFVVRHGRAGAAVADLGCGPGFTTELLAETLAPSRLVAIDGSAQFLAAARRRVPEAELVVHDLTAAEPLPRGPFEVVYARLLLAHLPDPAAVVERWRRCLSPNGVVLIEDLEAVEAPPGPLRTYEEVSAAMVRRGGGVMYGGAAVAHLGGTLARVTVPATQAAAIYLYNVRRWLAAGADDDLRRLEAGLLDVTDGTVSWVVRQLVLDGLPADS